MKLPNYGGGGGKARGSKRMLLRVWGKKSKEGGKRERPKRPWPRQSKRVRRGKKKGKSRVRTSERRADGNENQEVGWNREPKDGNMVRGCTSLIKNKEGY